MTISDSDTLCPGCFDYQGQANPCPRCDYAVHTERDSPALPHFTLLQGRYLIGRILGANESSITYLGWDQSLQARVVIKEYLPGDLTERRRNQIAVMPYGYENENGDLFRYYLGQFLDEADIRGQVDHPNVERIRNLFQANGTGYLVADYYDGMSLAEYLARQCTRLPEDTARQLITQTLDGLRAIHARGILHRGVTPEHIYLAHTETGGARPILTGCNKGALEEALRARDIWEIGIEDVTYVPFEQLYRRGKRGPWTDVYGAAAVLYRMVTGTPPLAALERRDSDPLKPTSDFGVSKALSDVIAAGLALKPEDRPQTAQAFLTQLVRTGAGEAATTHRGSQCGPLTSA